MVHMFSLARLACGSARGWATTQLNTRVRLKTELGRSYEEIAQLREEIRLNAARMVRVPAHRRPCHSPAECMSILGLWAARGRSLAQAATVALPSSTAPISANFLEGRIGGSPWWLR